MRISERVITLLSESSRHSEQLLFGYVPFRSEVDIRGVFEWCWRQRIGLAVPRVIAGQRLAWHRLTSFDQLISGAYGIMEPDPTVCELIKDYTSVRHILIPGVGFDAQGGRMGYGGGYYDRFLSQLPDEACKIAVAFDDQVVEGIPLDRHDYHMDQIITDARVIVVNPPGG